MSTDEAVPSKPPEHYYEQFKKWLRRIINNGISAKNQQTTLMVTEMRKAHVFLMMSWFCGMDENIEEQKYESLDR